jgi:acyl-CoA thioesterase I
MRLIIESLKVDLTDFIGRGSVSGYYGLLRYLRFLALMTIVSTPVYADQRPVILVLGDSLSAAYGMSEEQGWVFLLQQRLDQNGCFYQVVNASISGDTTRGGSTRLPQAMSQYRPRVVIVELGGNDGLRGLSLVETRRNLANILEMVCAQGAQAVVAGMRIPPNYGFEYTESFHAMYADLAQRFDAALVPFLLEGIALKQALMQPDGIHPNAAAQMRIVDNLWPHLESLLVPPNRP